MDDQIMIRERIVRVEDHCLMAAATLTRLERKINKISDILRTVEHTSIVNKTKIAMIASASGVVTSAIITIAFKLLS